MVCFFTLCFKEMQKIPSQGNNLPMLFQTTLPSTLSNIIKIQQTYQAFQPSFH